MYLDPGAAGVLIQGLIAAVVGVGLTLKLYWSKIRGLGASKTTDAPPSDGPDA